MLLILMIGMVSSAWGADPTIIWSRSDSDISNLPANSFTAGNPGDKLRISTSGSGDIWFCSKTYKKYFDSKDKFYTSNGESDHFYAAGYFEFDLSASIINMLNNEEVYLQGENGLTVTEVSIQHAAVSSFEGQLKADGTDNGEYTEMVTEPLTNIAVNLTLAKAWENCANPVYARFQVIKEGTPIDLSLATSLLTVTGKSVQLPDKGVLGYYVYDPNGISASDLTVTLHAVALKYSEYQVLCYLSSGEESDEFEYDVGNAKVKKEPNWDVKFTYKFKNDLIEITRQLDASSLTNPYAQINIHQDVLDILGTTEDKMKDSWHGHWFVRHKDNHSQQDIAWGNSQAEGKWNLWVGNNNGNWFQGNHYGATIMLNYALCGYDNVDGSSAGSSNRLAGLQQTMGFLQIYAPSGYTTMQGASDFEFVYEVTDEYKPMGGPPPAKLRYIFQIPSFENEPNTGMVEDVKPQTVPVRSQASFTLGDMPTDAKYARFYLVDKNNNVVEPGTVLSVSGGTACGKTMSGIYLYDNGSTISPNVTIKAPNAYKTYKVVGLFSTTMTDPLLNGSTLIQEPKWDLQRTYTFDYTITTNEKNKTIEWDAAAMAVDASAAPDLDTDWHTSIDEMTTGQCIKWYVVDGSNAKQPLALGSARIGESWAIGLPHTFTVTDNVASQSNFTSIEASQLQTWVTTNVYAPNGVTYAEVANHKIVCEIYTNNEGTGNPNARYTFTIHKGFLGSLKNGVTETTERVLLAYS